MIVTTNQAPTTASAGTLATTPQPTDNASGPQEHLATPTSAVRLEEASR